MSKKTTHDAYHERRLKFLKELEKHGIVRLAAKRADLDNSELYQRRKNDPEFAKAWEAAMEIGNQLIHDEIRHRAMRGDKTPITVAGEREVVRKKDTKLLIMLAKAKFEEYRDHSKVDMNATLVDQSQPYKTLLDRIRNKQPSGESYNGNGKHEENGDG